MRWPHGRIQEFSLVEAHDQRQGEPIMGVWGFVSSGLQVQGQTQSFLALRCPPCPKGQNLHILHSSARQTGPFSKHYIGLPSLQDPPLYAVDDCSDTFVTAADDDNNNK